MERAAAFGFPRRGRERWIPCGPLNLGDAMVSATRIFVCSLFAWGVASAEFPALRDALERLEAADPDVRAQAEVEILAWGEPIRTTLQSLEGEVGPEARFRIQILYDKLDAALIGMPYDSYEALKLEIAMVRGDDAEAAREGARTLSQRLRTFLSSTTEISHDGALMLLRLLLPLAGNRQFQTASTLPQLACHLRDIPPPLSQEMESLTPDQRWSILLPVALNSGRYDDILTGPLAEALEGDTYRSADSAVALAAALVADRRYAQALYLRSFGRQPLAGALAVLAFAGALEEAEFQEAASALLSSVDPSGTNRNSRRGTLTGDVVELLFAGSGGEEVLDGYFAGSRQPALPQSWNFGDIYAVTGALRWEKAGPSSGALEVSSSQGLVVGCVPLGSGATVVLARALPNGDIGTLQIGLSSRLYVSFRRVHESHSLVTQASTPTAFSARYYGIYRVLPFDQGLSEDLQALDYVARWQDRLLQQGIRSGYLARSFLEDHLEAFHIDVASKLAASIADQSERARGFLSGVARGPHTAQSLRAARALASHGDPEALRLAGEALEEGSLARAHSILAALQLRGGAQVDLQGLLVFLGDGVPLGVFTLAEDLLEVEVQGRPSAGDPATAEGRATRRAAWQALIEAKRRKP